MNCNLSNIHKLRLIRTEAKRIKEELLKTQQKFQNFVSELDEGYNFDRMSIDEKIIALNTISAKGDYLENQLKTLELNFYEIELQLKN